MGLISIYILVIAIFTAMAASLPGLFLVLGRVALMSDAISHAMLPGIVIMFLVVQRLGSGWLFVGACIAGLLLVWLTELIIYSKRIRQEVAIGLIFPLFFSIGVVLISRYTSDVHLDADMVLLGDIVFTPFSKLILCGIDLGPYAAWLTGFLFIANCLFVTLCYKQLVVATADSAFGITTHYNARFCYQLLMIMTSITAVAAFDVVGSIVVVALMIVPAATALLLSKSLEQVVYLTLVVAVAAAISGYFFAHYVDVSIAGSISVMAGVIFAIVLICGPYGFYAFCAQRKARKRVLEYQVIAAVCAENAKKGGLQPSISEIASLLGWQPEKVLCAVSFGQKAVNK